MRWEQVQRILGSTELCLKHGGFDMHLKRSNEDVPQELEKTKDSSKTPY